MSRRTTFDIGHKVKPKAPASPEEDDSGIILGWISGRAIVRWSVAGEEHPEDPEDLVHDETLMFFDEVSGGWVNKEDSST